MCIYRHGDVISYNLLEQSLPPLRHTFPWNASVDTVESWKNEELSRNIPSLYSDSHVLIIIHMILSQLGHSMSGVNKAPKEGKVILGEVMPWLIQLSKTNSKIDYLSIAIQWLLNCNITPELLQDLSDQGNIKEGNGILSKSQYDTCLLSYCTQHRNEVAIRGGKHLNSESALALPTYNHQNHSVWKLNIQLNCTK